jgi:integrase
VTGAGFTFLDDLDATRAAAWLEAFGTDRESVTVPPGDSFSPGGVARLFGWCRQALRQAIIRGGFPRGEGRGKARRIPRSTVEALAFRAARGASPETVNHHIRAVKGFCRWLVKNRRMAHDPLITLTLQNSKVDVRHARRELSAEELRLLLQAARSSPHSFRGLAAADRHALYTLACGSGLRVGALASLTPECFDLDSDRPTVTVSVRRDKSRKGKVQPLPADVAELLKRYIVGKPAGKAIWPGGWPKVAADMLRIDLEAAGIPYVIDGPDGPEHADFHSLRHSYLTLGSKSGIDLRTLQELAGHSTPALTARYSHRRLHDLAGAVEKLPSVLTPCSDTESHEITLPATGTDGAGLSPVCIGFAQTDDPGCDQVRRDDTPLSVSTGSGVVVTLDGQSHLRPLETDRDGKSSEAPPGFEPGCDGFAIRCLTAWRRGPAFDTLLIGGSGRRLEASRPPVTPRAARDGRARSRNRTRPGQARSRVTAVRRGRTTRRDPC